MKSTRMYRQTYTCIHLHIRTHAHVQICVYKYNDLLGIAMESTRDVKLLAPRPVPLRRRRRLLHLRAQLRERCGVLALLRLRARARVMLLPRLDRHTYTCID